MAETDDFDFGEAVSIDPVFEPTNRFLEPIWIFASRLESLQRYFEFNARYVDRYIRRSQESLSRLTKHSKGAEALDLHGDMTAMDRELFSEYLRASVLSHLFTLIEGLLADVADDVAETLGQPLELPTKPMPYLNRYIAFLKERCGLSIAIDKETWRTIDALRAVRNRYVHRLDRDLPQQIQIQLQRLVDEANKPEAEVNDVFVRTAFVIVGRVATQLDKAYWSFIDRQIKT